MHDSIIEEYRVDFKAKTLLIKTHSDKTNHETVFFAQDVLTHYFENILTDNIVLSVDELPIGHFLSDNRSLLLDKKPYCWPIQFQSIDDLEDYLVQNKYKYIVICSSYGLCGWILARSYYIQQT